MLKVMENKITGLMSFLTLCVLIVLPVSLAVAQEAPIDQQFFEAAEDLDLDAQLEFLELIRQPGHLEGAFEDLGVDPELADRIEERLNQKHNTDYALERLNTVTNVIGAHLEKLANQHAGKSRKALENALARRTAGLTKAKAAVSKNVPANPGNGNAPDPGANGGNGGNGGAGGNGAGGNGAGGNGAGGNGAGGNGAGGNGNGKNK